jgi:hypothetical protein
MKIVAPVGGGQKENVSIRDAAAHGCDDTFVDCILTMYAAFYLKWSTKVNGPNVSGSGSKVAMKLAHGDGLLNVARLIAIVVRSLLDILRCTVEQVPSLSYQRPATLA